MRQPILVLVLTVFTSTACLFSPDLVKPADPIPSPTVKPMIQIQGRAFMDVNQDGVFEPTEDTIMDGVRIDLFSLSDPEIPVQSTTTEGGQYLFELPEEGEYFLRFSQPEAASAVDFTEKGAGDDDIDSDVNDTGTTDPFRASFGFSRVLSAGFVSGEPPVEAAIYIEDEVDDCQSQNQETGQSCAADIQSCATNFANAPKSFRLICFVDQFEDPTEFDLYIGLNLDADLSTGLMDEQRQGVDAEIYANGLDGYINLNRYDPSGVFLDTRQFEEEIAQFSFQSSEDLAGGALMVDLNMDDNLRAAIPTETEVGFRAIHFAASGAQLHDDTPAVGGVFLDKNLVQEQTHIVHTVREGDNLFRISLLYGVPVEIILTVNESSTGTLTVGEKLLIPKDGWD
jgi:LysM repeat protein